MQISIDLKRKWLIGFFCLIFSLCVVAEEPLTAKIYDVAVFSGSKDFTFRKASKSEEPKLAGLVEFKVQDGAESDVWVIYVHYFPIGYVLSEGFALSPDMLNGVAPERFSNTPVYDEKRAILTYERIRNGAPGLYAIQFIREGFLAYSTSLEAREAETVVRVRKKFLDVVDRVHVYPWEKREKFNIFLDRLSSMNIESFVTGELSSSRKTYIFFLNLVRHFGLFLVLFLAPLLVWVFWKKTFLAAPTLVISWLDLVVAAGLMVKAISTPVPGYSVYYFLPSLFFWGSAFCVFNRWPLGHKFSILSRWVSLVVCGFFLLFSVSGILGGGSASYYGTGVAMSVFGLLYLYLTATYLTVNAKRALGMAT